VRLEALLQMLSLNLSNVESHSTALSAMPGPLSSSNRHVILVFCVSFSFVYAI